MPAALVTGCSSGIGRATALRLQRAGLSVYATARDAAALGELAGGGIVTLPLDVTDEDSMTAAVERVVADHGALAALVNNAGFELVGPLEETPPADVRRQFEVNVIGLIRLTQLALPHLRVRGGRIVNVSSVFGRFAVPGGALYGASKHAVAGLTDGLRRELAPLGVDAVLVEPTATRTRLNANTVVVEPSAPDSPYARLRETAARWHDDTYAQPARTIAGRFALEADDVARVIVRAVTARRPKARYPVGVLAHGLFQLRRWLPDPVFDAFVRSQFAGT
jgi:NAD(P)-dependent dehydrogenase (short-subunit alcohol dehydrogenase family)